MEEAPEIFHCSAGGGSDHFVVEDLLDFSNEEETDAAAVCDVVTDDSTVTDSCNSSSFSGGLANLSDESGCLADATNFSGDLFVPCDDLAELEWLSNFVEESFSSEDLENLQLISGFKTRPDQSTSHARNFQPDSNNFIPNPNNSSPIFTTDVSVPAKARSKRSRAAACHWASSSLLVDSPAQTYNPFTPETAAPSHPPSPPPQQNTVKKLGGTRKKDAGASPGDSSSNNGEEGRRCLHCATDKTPQWRTGPMGPKTLCNACGVRYKSGRLVPEYRPAASPTFVLTKHSNSHRKVMELRRQKELMRGQQQFFHPQMNMVFDVSSTGEDYLIHQNVGPDFTQLI